MKKYKTQSVGDVIKEYLEVSHLGKKMKVSMVEKYWASLMGNIIAEKTTNIYLKNKTLFISLNSSVLRNELNMMRSRIAPMMNDKMNGNYIDKVVIR